LKKLFLTYIFFYILIINSFSQSTEIGRPYIQNFSPREYGYESQNFSVRQDLQAVIFIGNLNGVLEYNGVSWKLINVKGHPVLDVDNKGRVFVGSRGDFGYLANNNKNERMFFSLLSKIDPKQRNFDQINKVVSIGKDVLFSTDNKLFKFSEDVIELIDEFDTTFSIFKINYKTSDKIITRVFLNKPGKGLMIYDQGRFNLMVEGYRLKNKIITDIIPYGSDDILIKLQGQPGFLLFSANKFSVFRTEVDEFIQKNELTKGIGLNDTYLALGTRRGGIVLIDKNGRLISILNKQNGLFDDSVTDLYLDLANNLWITMNNGISRVEFLSQINFFDKNYGIKGSVSSVTRYRGKLYIATNHGVSMYSNLNVYDESINSFRNEKKFIPVSGINAECYELCQIKDELYVTSNRGAFQITGTNAKLAYAVKARILLQSKKFPEIIYSGGKDGLVAFVYQWNKLTFTGKLKNIQGEVRSVAETSDGALWLGTEYNGIYYVNCSGGFRTDLPVKHYQNNSGLPFNERWSDVYQTAEGILFSTPKGIYRFDPLKSWFIRDTLLGIDFTNSNRWVFPLKEDFMKNIWLSSGFSDKFEKQTGVSEYSAKGKKYRFLTLPSIELKDFMVETIYPDLQIIWFGGDEGLIRFDYQWEKKDTSFRYPCFISRIVTRVDSSIFSEADIIKTTVSNITTNLRNIPRFSYNLSSILFEFAAPFYESENNIQYQYFLENYDNTWSEWSLRNIKEYTSLSEGTYIFKVRARNLLGNISDEATYRFTIKPPYFRTVWAYIAYVVLLSSFTLMLLRIRSYQFAKEKSKLETIIRERTEELLKENERAQDLLVNMLPKQTAQELKIKGKATTIRFDMVTVLFSDIQGFSQISEKMNPELLVERLDELFYQFDLIAEKYNLEKIKTIGDGYMCAGGIPEKNRTNPVDVLLAALEMQLFIKTFKFDEREIFHDWGLRIGVHTGSVIAGVIGRKKYMYDIYGVTVNTANRMEFFCERNEINISGSTWEYVKNYFICESRGKISVKYMGNIDMYFVKSIKPSLVEIHKGTIIPNQKFNNLMAKLRFEDLKDLILEKMRKELPANLYYHSVEHTIDVMIQVEYIGEAEKISEEDLLLLRTAALLHDIGFTIAYDKHEIFGVKIAGELLPQYLYSKEQIDSIGELIMCTRNFTKPANRLEQIMCDADLDYLGREDFEGLSKSLYMELAERKKVRSVEDWNKTQIRFIEKHFYFTETARRLRDAAKKQHLEKLRKMETVNA
jgi:class 3 adenylate cyclase/HD superfamily phosphodiesterase